MFRGYQVCGIGFKHEILLVEGDLPLYEIVDIL